MRRNKHDTHTPARACGGPQLAGTDIPHPRRRQMVAAKVRYHGHTRAHRDRPNTPVFVAPSGPTPTLAT